MATIDGLATGLDTTTIIDGLVRIQQLQVDQLTARKNSILEEQTAFKGIESKMIDLRAQLGSLARSQNSVFSARSAVSSDEDALTVTAATGAAAGVYNLTINSLAQAEQVASQGFASADSEISQGTFSLRVGRGKEVEITIDSSNNTLQGLADAINAAGGDVGASIVNDGSTGGTPYKLLLSSSKTGAANTITITNNLAAGATQPDFTGTPVQAAADASVTLGSGAGALTVTHDTNQLDDLIGGVTLDLHQADAAKSISVTIARDTDTAVATVQRFVEAFNGLMGFIDDQVRFEPQSGEASLLLGNRSVIGIQDEVRRITTGIVTGVSSDLNRLSAIGISVTDQGRLTLNSGRLRDALNGGIPGVGETDFRRLFALDGASTNPGISFVLGSTRTKDSTTPIEIDVSQAAEQASVTATNALAASTVIDATNNEFALSLDGADSATLTLTEGTYTEVELAAELQAVINASDEFKGRQVAVSVQGGKLQINSETYGLASEVTIGSTGTALAALGFDGTETDKGQDVVGRFIVNGQAETAVGSGRILSGDPDNENTADLRVRVTLTSAQISGGVEGEMTISRGIASKLDKLLGSMLDPVTGRMKTISEGYDDRAAAIDKTIEARNKLLEAKKESLLAQFAALEGQVSQLQSTSNFLAAQLVGSAGGGGRVLGG